MMVGPGIDSNLSIEMKIIKLVILLILLNLAEILNLKTI